MLTPETLQVCKQHYGGYQAKVNGCHRCPIRPECITNKPTRTAHEQDMWCESVNQAAEKWCTSQLENDV